MSKDSKLISKPKVRFCQTDTDKAKAKETIDSSVQKTVKQYEKPKIISVEVFDANTTPFRLVNKSFKKTKICKNKNSEVTDNLQRRLLISSKFPRTIQSTSSLNKERINTENQKPLIDADNNQNIKANSKAYSILKTSTKSLKNNTVTFNKQNENVNKLFKLKNYKRDIKEKKNETVVSKDLKALTKKFSDLDILRHKLSSPNADTNTTSVSGTIRKHLNPKPVANNVMPCYKYKILGPKTKTSHVKKNVILDGIGPKIKPSISPGIQHKKENNLNLTEEESIHMKSDLSGEKFAKPEYNSIICTIAKLNEMQKQVAMTDKELPLIYNHTINKKVSTALDFPLDETIYKNLISIVIDENQLPSRLTRSKSPEPRQRDIVPVLSDFFRPLSTDEYCTAAAIKPRTPEVEENWNAFKISDQIYEWRRTSDE